MACSLTEFRDRKIKESLALVYNAKALAYRQSSPNSIVITPSSKSQIKTVDQAYNTAMAMEQKIAKQFGEHYNFKTYGKWTTIRRGHNSVTLEVNIPPNLLNAYRIRQLKKETPYYNTETAKVEEVQKGQLSFFDIGVPNAIDQINYKVVYDYKVDMLKKVKRAIQNERANKVHDNTHITTISAKIRSLQKTEKKLEEDIVALGGKNLSLAQLSSIVENDLKVIDSLLADLSLENIHTAQRMLNFYQGISDDKFGAKNEFLVAGLAFDEKNKSVLSQDVKNILDLIKIKVSDRESELNAGKREYLKKLIDNSSQVQEYIDKTGEEIDIDELLKPLKDIDVMSTYTLTIDKQYISKDSLLAQLIKIEYELKRTEEKSKVAKMIERLDAANKSIIRKLPKIPFNISWFNKSSSESDYSIFYQKNSIGSKTGKLITKFSGKWDRLLQNTLNNIDKRRKKAYALADKAERGNALNKINADRFAWYNAHTDFIDITLLPEIVNDVNFSTDLAGFDTTGSDKYKTDLIAKIGQNYYDKIVKEQVALLRDYKSWMYETIIEDLQRYNVKTPMELPLTALNSLKVKILVNNPFEVLKSKKENQGGRVSFENDNTSIQYQSLMNYNSFIPKEQIETYNNNTGATQLVNSDYYNEDFKTIEQDSDLYEFWESLEESLSYINMTLADAEKQLVHGSILSMQKSFLDILLNPDGASRVNKRVQLSSWLKQGLKSQFESARVDKDSNDFDEINKSQFKSTESEVEKVIRLTILKVQRETGFKGEDVVNLDVPLSNEAELYKVLAKELGSPDTAQGLKAIIPFPNPNNKNIYVKDLIKMFAEGEVAKTQTSNLPVLVRAYLEMTAEYKAQRDSQPTLEIVKEFYDEIKREGTNRSFKNWAINKMRSNKEKKEIGSDRVNAKIRMDNWYNKNIKGLSDVSTAGFVTVTYTDYEKDLIKELNYKLQNANLTEAEKEEIHAEIEIIGKNITLTNVYNAIINSFAIFKGLAYSLKSTITNRFQGFTQGMVHAGRYYSEENFYKANGFVFYRGLSKLPGNSSYKEEVKKVKLLVNLLNIIQDATNEMDRARRSSGVSSGVRQVISPYYATEYVEWNNQVPQILAMLGDKTIKDVNGIEYPIFDGTGLPAYEIKDGKLKLKPEFADLENEHTKDNLSTWENVSSKEAGAIKLYMSEVISIANGDYSKSGVTLIKKYAVGKTVMLFKSWLPNYVWARIAYKQDNLILGKKGINGIYTSHRTSTALVTAGTLGFLAAGPVGTLIAGAAAIGVSRFIAKKMDRETGGLFSDLLAVKEMSIFARAIVQKMIALPVNGFSGKQRIGSADLSSIAVSKEDEQNLQSIVGEISILLTLVLFKILWKSALGGGDDDEPKTFGNGQPNPYYTNNARTEKEKTMYFILENQISGMINELESFQNPISFTVDTYNSNIAIKTFTNIVKLPATLAGIFNGTDTIKSGVTAGQSKAGNLGKDLFLPSFVKQLGFEKSAQRDFNSTEYIDTMFDTDYKTERSEIKGQRTEYKLEQIENLKEDYNYDNLSAEEQKLTLDIIEKQVNQGIEVEHPYPARFSYDENQKKQ
jgi:hypothetical protein